MWRGKRQSVCNNSKETEMSRLNVREECYRRNVITNVYEITVVVDVFLQREWNALSCVLRSVKVKDGIEEV